MAIEAAVRHFERASRDYGSLRNAATLGWLRRHEQRIFRDLVPLGAGDVVLDAGCGDGETLAWAASRRARAVGVDVAFGMASACRRLGFEVCVQDMEALGLRRRFDWVLCVGSLEFTADPQRAVDGFARALRPGGRLVLLYPRRGPIGWLYALYHRRHGVRVRLFSRHDVERLFERAGLERPSAWRHSLLSSACVAERKAQSSDDRSPVTGHRAPADR